MNFDGELNSSIKEYDNKEDKRMNLKTVIEILNKQVRKSVDIDSLQEYFKSLEHFQNNFIEKNENYKELMTSLCLSIKYEYYMKNTMIFKTGEISDRFYIILDGKVSVLLAKEIKMDLTVAEYLCYLKKLRQYNERELLSLNLTNNRATFIGSNDFNTFFKKKKKKSRIHKILDVSKLNLDDDDEKSNITPEQYINRLKPTLLENSIPTERKTLKLWKYYNILTLVPGDKFGDYALAEKNRKRSATIITESNCHLGSLGQFFYDSFFKEYNERNLKDKETFFISHQLFEGLDRKGLTKRYFQYFLNEKILVKEKILSEGKSSQFYYFIKKGEFEVSMKCSLFDLENIIKNFEKKLDIHVEELKEKDDVHKFQLEKKKFKFSILTINDVVGMQDMIYLDKNIFTVTCISNKGEIFKISKEFLEEIIESVETLRNNFNKFLKLKLNYIIQRLKNILRYKIQIYKKNFLKGKDINLFDLYEKLGKKYTNPIPKISNTAYISFLDKLSKRQQEMFDKNESKRLNYFDKIYNIKKKDNHTNSIVLKNNVSESYLETKLVRNKSSFNSMIFTKNPSINSSIYDAKFKPDNFSSFLIKDKIIPNDDENSDSRFKDNRVRVIDCLVSDKYNRVMYNMEKTLSKSKSVFNLSKNTINNNNDGSLISKSLMKNKKPNYFIVKNKEKKEKKMSNIFSNNSKSMIKFEITKNLNIVKINY